MCGIAGIIKIGKGVEHFEIKNMTDVIAHRGPDGEGHWLNPAKNVALGHRRLSIIDLSNHAAQPMHFSNDRFTITFNGEIYNYVELRSKLVAQGIKFQSQSDTEVLLALYATKKEACLEDLDGMFAFAIWDEEEKKLFCARDRFGEKPLHYYFEEGKEFIFSSEIKQLFSYGIPKENNNSILFNFFLNSAVLHDPRVPEATFFKNICRLEPAHYLIIDADLKITKKRYWDLDLSKSDNKISVDDAASKFYDLLLKSVEIRLRSDVPVGSSLSGGLDSSTIVCLIDQLNSNSTIKQKTFSARFNNFEKDEGYFMQKVIDSTKAEPFFTYPDEQAFASDLLKMCWHQEEPFGGASVFAQWEVMKLAKEKGVTVLLDGQGADESLAGYHFYFHTYLKELKATGSPLFETELAAYRNRHNTNFNLDAAPNKKVSVSLKNLLRVAYRSIFPAPQLPINGSSPDFLNPEFTAQFNNKETLSSAHSGGLREQLYVNNCVIGLNNLLRFADRNSMAFSREMRLPFLSHHVVEFLFTLPNEYKIYDGWTKFVMRKAFENILPAEITWRVDKIGYEPPQKKWMQSKEIAAITSDSIAKLEQNGIVNKKRKTEGAKDRWAAIVVANTMKV